MGFFDITTPGTQCPPSGSIGMSINRPAGGCYPPCAHQHPIDGVGGWSVYAADSTSWLGMVPQWNGSEFVPLAIGGGGTVTSVAFSAASIFTVSGSPITTMGTIALGLDIQSANTVLAGPTTGGSIQPTFRSLVNADLPDSGVSAGAYTILTVNTKGVVTSATGDSVSANTFLAGATSGGAAAPSYRAIVNADFPNSGVSPGTYTSVTVDAKGIVTGGTSTSYLSNALTNTYIFVGNGSNIATGVALTLNSSAGAFALSNTGVITFPDASTTTRGLVNYASQNFKGIKTFEYDSGITNGIMYPIISTMRSSGNAGVDIGYYCRSVASSDSAAVHGNTNSNYLTFGKGNIVQGGFRLSATDTLFVVGQAPSAISGVTGITGNVKGGWGFDTNSISSLISTTNYPYIYNATLSGGAGDLVVQARPVTGRGLYFVTGAIPVVRVNIFDNYTEITNAFVCSGTDTISATTGTSTISNNVRGAYLTGTATALTLKLPASPQNGQEVVVINASGGTRTLGASQDIDIQANTGHTLAFTLPVNLKAGESIGFKFRGTDNKWYSLFYN